MTGRARLANEAWEALFRAQVTLMRTFAADDIWTEVSQHEYDVLYTLSRCEAGLTSAEVNRNILMTQGGVSRLVTRLVERGLVERCTDPGDRRAARLVLTEAGRELQRSVGRRHARSVTQALSAALGPDELRQVRDLSRRLVAATDPAGATAGTGPTTPDDPDLTTTSTTTTTTTDERA